MMRTRETIESYRWTATSPETARAALPLILEILLDIRDLLIEERDSIRGEER